MKLSIKYFMLLAAGIILTTAGNVNAQSTKANTFSSKITIMGTSTIHDWESKTEQITGEFEMNNTSEIQSLTVKIPVVSIKSGDRLMDKKTYEAFKSDKFPVITFLLSEPATPVVTNSDVHVTLTGNLIVSGVTKKITFKSTGKKTSAGGYQLTGSVPLKMTDFKIKPPTALFGTIRSGDAITIKLDIIVLPQNLVVNN
ncbi:MAG: YceI family protein [uncultured bacterium]|nr:MAG: YceI family protein [uncultured bacterium]HBY02248.1 hypothetical protein [Rikenellaceae bacterium]